METKFEYPEDMPQKDIDMIEHLAKVFIAFSEIDKNAVMNSLQEIRKDERLNFLQFEPEVRVCKKHRVIKCAICTEAIDPEDI